MADPLTNFLAIRSQLDTLSNLLGPPFEPPKPLEAVAGPSRLTLPLSEGSRKSDVPRASAPTSTPIGLHESTSWLDVGEAVMEALEADLQKAIEERVSGSE
jgi:protein regulator of cytokinesis 1